MRERGIHVSFPSVTFKGCGIHRCAIFLTWCLFTGSPAAAGVTSGKSSPPPLQQQQLTIAPLQLPRLPLVEVLCHVTLHPALLAVYASVANSQLTLLALHHSGRAVKATGAAGATGQAAHMAAGSGSGREAGMVATAASAATAICPAAVAPMVAKSSMLAHSASTPGPQAIVGPSPPIPLVRGAIEVLAPPQLGGALPFAIDLAALHKHHQLSSLKPVQASNVRAIHSAPFTLDVGPVLQLQRPDAVARVPRAPGGGGMLQAGQPAATVLSPNDAKSMLRIQARVLEGIAPSKVAFGKKVPAGAVEASQQVFSPPPCGLAVAPGECQPASLCH